jgi:hypothetical protein
MTPHYNNMPPLTGNPHQQRSQGLQTSQADRQNASPTPSVTITVTNQPSTDVAMEMDNAIQSIIHTLEQEDLQPKETNQPGTMEVDQPSNTSINKPQAPRPKTKKTANNQK